MRIWKECTFFLGHLWEDPILSYLSGKAVRVKCANLDAVCDIRDSGKIEENGGVYMACSRSPTFLSGGGERLWCLLPAMPQDRDVEMTPEISRELKRSSFQASFFFGSPNFENYHDPLLYR